MCKTLLCLLLAALFSCHNTATADPSKPIRDAMNHPASAFDLYMHTLGIELQAEFEKEREEVQLGRFLASLIERADLIDKTAKAGEEFSAEYVRRLKSHPNFHFSDFTYDFKTNQFTLQLGFHSPDSFPVLETDLSFDGEKKRKQFMEEVTERAWDRVSFKFPTHRIQNGYTSKGFDEEAFGKEVAANTVLIVEWQIFTRIPGEQSSTTAKQLAEKGVAIRTYKGTRSQNGVISVEYDDFVPKKEGSEKAGRDK
jgi:hypothetical protein